MRVKSVSSAPKARAAARGTRRGSGRCRVRVVDDRRGRARLVRDEQVALEAPEARRELGIVPFFARALLLLLLVVDLDQIVPVVHQRLLHALQPRDDVLAERRRARASSSFIQDRSMITAAAFENTSSRAASNPALWARTSPADFSTSRVSFASLSVSAFLVESSRTSNCSALTGLPCRIGNVCTPPCTALDAEANIVLGERLEADG